MVARSMVIEPEGDAQGLVIDPRHRTLKEYDLGPLARKNDNHGWTLWEMYKIDWLRWSEATGRWRKISPERIT